MGTIISVLLLIYLLSRQGWDEIKSAVISISPVYFSLAVALMLISRLMVCGRWYTLLRAGGQKISLLETIRLVFAGLFASNFLPTTIGGDVVRLAGGIRRGYDPVVITASLVTDRLTGMAGMASLLPVGVPYLLSTGEAISQTGMVVNFSGVAFVAGFRRWFKKIQAFAIETFRSMLLWVHKPGSLVLALFWTYGHQAALFTTVWILFRGMGEDISWWAVAGLWIFNYFITLLPVSINGMGVQELTIAYFFTQFGGVSTGAGLILAILIRLLYLLASLPGVVSLPEILNYDRNAGMIQKKQ